MQEINKDYLTNKESINNQNDNNYDNILFDEKHIFTKLKLNCVNGEEIENSIDFSSHEKKVLNFNNKFKEFNKNNIILKELKNSSIIPRNKAPIINEEENKTFQRSEIKHKTIANCSGNRKELEMRSIPQTSIQRIVKTMNKIKNKLLSYDEIDLVQEVKWVIKEILSDNMYKIKLNEKTSKEEKDFYNNYSNNQSELLLSRDISNYGI